ncbi:hypothetical protein TrST_g10740 [Triparma strigata]|uniref:Ubiquitin carboxyl-terminal hydrolase n=1 Tax=Triparma strigata TaxID=1606541 RepID=A0A9W7BX68_9STRA|nr:hypothetical protein TrST_g10740 [Triparma strigata]
MNILSICDNCGKEGAAKKCTRCKTKYCSKECQIEAWPTHKLDCAVKAELWKVQNESSSVLENLNSIKTYDVEVTDENVTTVAESMSDMRLEPQPQPRYGPLPAPSTSLLTPSVVDPSAKSSASLSTSPDERQSWSDHQYPHPLPAPRLIDLEPLGSPVREKLSLESTLPPFDRQKQSIINLLSDDPIYWPSPTPPDSKKRIMLPGPWFRTWLQCVNWLSSPPQSIVIPALNYTLKGFEQIEPERERPEILDYTVLTNSAGKLKDELVTFYDFYPVKSNVGRAFESWYGCKGTCTFVTNEDGAWIPKPSSSSPPPSSTFATCANCGGEGFKRCSKCKSVHYCSKKCQEFHWTHYHEQECCVPASSQQPVRPHKPGLTNLGNSCYMNSALQCVMHSQEVRRVFLSGDWQGYVNKDNWESTGGKLAGAFSRLIGQYYMDGESYISPIDFKRCVKDCDKEYGFGGLRQHDCTEFIIWLLDRMHEDLNVAVIPKPYVEFTDSDGTNQAVASRVNHEKDLLRDDSELSKVFRGQWQSTCICPICKNVSVKFEPFNTNTLEVKTTDTKSSKPIHVFLFRRAGEGKRAPKPVEAYVEVPKNGDLSDVRTALAKIIGNHIHPDCLVLADVYQNNFFKYFSDGVGHPSSGFEETDEMGVYECHAPVSEEFTQAAIVQCNRQGSPMGWPVISDLKRTDTCKEVKLKVWKLFRRIMGKKNAYTEDHAFFGMTEAQISEFGIEHMGLWIVNTERELKGSRDGVINYRKGEEIPADDGLVFFGALEHEGERKEIVYLVVVWKPEFQGIVDETEMVDKIRHPESCNNAAGFSSGNALSLDSLFTMQSKPERLDSMYCSHCKDHTKAIKTLRPRRLPNILIITFKRFEIRNGRMTKVKTFVDFPIDNLDMSKHSLAHSEVEKGAMAGGPSSALYDLFGVVQHYGNAGYGHYTSCCRAWEGRQTGLQGEMEPNFWCYDDNTVTKVAKKDEIVNEYAYALFYRRKAFI